MPSWSIRYSAACSQTIFERTLPLFSLDEYRFSYLSERCTAINCLSKQVVSELALLFVFLWLLIWFSVRGEQQESHQLFNESLEKSILQNLYCRFFCKNVGLQNRGKDHIIIPFFRTMFVLLSNQILVSFLLNFANCVNRPSRTI